MHKIIDLNITISISKWKLGLLREPLKIKLEKESRINKQ